MFSIKSFSKLKHWNCSTFPLFITKKHVDLFNGGLFWKSLVPFLRRIYVLSVGFKMKPLGKSVFRCLDKNQSKFCRKTCWKEQPFIFTVYLMNHIFQTSVLIMECIELNWLCKHMKKVRSSQAAILVMNWVKQSFSLWVSLKTFQVWSRTLV